MPKLEQQIEAILFYKNEPVTLDALAKLLKAPKDDVRAALDKLQSEYRDRGLVIVTDGEEVAFGTNPALSGMIEDLRREELSREIGRAGLETLAIILYKGPISRREIDYIRGVNSGFILRNLLIRGLIERAESGAGERSYSYKATLKLLEHLGVTRKEDLPEFGSAFQKLTEFAAEHSDEAQ